MRTQTLVASAVTLFLATACSKTSFVGGKNNAPSPQGPTAPLPPPTQNGPVVTTPPTTGTGTPTGTVTGVPQQTTKTTPVQQTPVQQTPVQQTPVQQAPVQQAPASTHCTSGTAFAANFPGYGTVTLKAIPSYEARIQYDSTGRCFLHAVPKTGTAAVTSLPVNRGFVLQSATAGYAFAAGDQTNCTRVGNTLYIGPMVGGKPFVGYAPVPTVDSGTLALVNVYGHMKPPPSRYDAFPLVTMQSNVCFANYAGYTVLFKDELAK